MGSVVGRSVGNSGQRACGATLYRAARCPWLSMICQHTVHARKRLMHVVHAYIHSLNTANSVRRRQSLDHGARAAGVKAERAARKSGKSALFCNFAGGVCEAHVSKESRHGS